MAGVVAMASVIEDFETQPCKKLRKDGDVPVVKTITNYFSPVPKPTAKPFSPPRSNNIMDYFSRKTPLSKERTSTPEQPQEKPNRPPSVEKQPTPDSAVKQPARPPQKRGRKPSKAARRLQEPVASSPGEDDDCLIVEESGEGQDSAAQSISSRGLLGSDTAALLSQLCAQTSVVKEDSNAVAVCVVDQDKTDEVCNESPKDGSQAKLKPRSNGHGVSPVAASKEKVKRVKPVTKNPKKTKSMPAESEPEVEEVELSLCGASMEVNVDEASELNSSTVTISFEDFLQSQIHGEEGEERKVITETEQTVSGQLDLPKPVEQDASEEPLTQQVSPRTLTFQAEVHAVSPKEEPAKPQGKMASIFARRKGAGSPAEVKTTTTPGSQATPEVPPISTVPKRKSNVVLREEDLELAVVESESTPKCSQAERKQFMAAFKQPSLDGAKAKPGKSQAKQKHPAESTAEAGDKEAQGVSGVLSSDDQPTTTDTEETGTKKKRGRKKAQKPQKEPETASPAAASQHVAADAENEESNAKPDPGEATATSTPSVQSVRRTRRQTPLKPAPVNKPQATRGQKKTRSQGRPKDAVAPQDNPAQDNPVQLSTPKMHRSKHRMYKAEMLTPADEKGSPIRMKFTRVLRNATLSDSINDFEILSPAPNTTTNVSKKRKQAKKLVEKAKAIQQSKKSTAEQNTSLRRSLRTQTSAQRSYCEDEDSIVCLDDIQAGPAQPAAEKGKAQKHLRNMNEVLGKAGSVNKDSKTPPASKVAPLFQGKKAQRASAVVSIFDESSRECSDNSQDSEQFRARREFLKSGLPDSFKKQMAKTAATKEAYSLSCASFQTVVHVLQTPQDSPLWSLPWPETSRLHCLRDFCCSASRPLPPLKAFFCLKTEPASRSFSKKGSGWRPELPDCVRQHLMEEIGTFNPSFPAQKFFTRFLKKRADYLQQFTASEPQALAAVGGATALSEPMGGKRKREDEGEVTEKVVKKKRAGRSQVEQTSTPEPRKRGGRLSRAERCRLEEEERAKVTDSRTTTPLVSQSDEVIVLDDSPVLGNTGNSDVVKEDVLWTEKYQPQHSTDIIGNTASVRRLHSWLKEWKLRADREERRKQKEKKQEDDNNDQDQDWDCGEEDSMDVDDLVCNTLLITGPTGVGKTAAVYACAQELGFKVFEVNASSQRSGRLILSQLREATQSHQVDIQGPNAHKPSYFNSYSTGVTRSGSSPRKLNSPRRVVSSPRKPPQSPRSTKRGGLAPVSLANFFKVGQPTSKEPAATEKKQQMAAPKKPKTKESAKPKEPLVKPVPTATPNRTPGEEQNKKTATSLILFEEVDVIFDDDSGFLAAIKTFMTTTKRPVILTTSDPNFSSMFDGSFEEIHFKTPSVLDVGSYLRLVCLAEDMRTDPQDISSLLHLNGYDIRRSLLQLQYWTRSAGGRHMTRPLMQSQNTALHTEVKAEEPDKGDGQAVCEGTNPTSLPPCDTGCTESMLGLVAAEPKRFLQEWLTSQCPVKEMVTWSLLADCRRRGVDLLYSNMEPLLPLPLTQLTAPPPPSVPTTHHQPSSEPPEPPSTCPQPDAVPSHARLALVAEVDMESEDGSPVKVSNRMKRKKRRQHCLTDQEALNSDSDSDNGFLSLPKPLSTSQKEEEEEEEGDEDETKGSHVVETAPAPVKMKREPLTPEQRMKSVPVSLCLGSMADFLDHMSYMDANLCLGTTSPLEGSRHRTVGPLGGAETKDGMTDEPRVELGGVRWAEEERAVEIQAAVEALGFQRCRARVEEAWSKAQQLEETLREEATVELTLPVAQHREAFSLTQDSPARPKLFQRRAVLESLLYRGVFGTLGNKTAAAQDYLPTLRTICRSEQLKEQGKVKRRFLHYLDAIHLGIPKNTLLQLAEDFP